MITTHIVDDDRPAEQSKADLLSMALVNKTLYEPTMDAMWYTVHDFNRLLACLPQHLWRSVKYEESPRVQYSMFGPPPPQRYKVSDDDIFFALRILVSQLPSEHASLHSFHDLALNTFSAG